MLKRHRKVGGIVAPRKGRPIRDNQYAWSLSEPSVVLDEWTTKHGQLLLELRLTISDAGERRGTCAIRSCPTRRRSISALSRSSRRSICSGHFANSWGFGWTRMSGDNPGFPVQQPPS